MASLLDWLGAEQRQGDAVEMGPTRRQVLQWGAGSVAAAAVSGSTLAMAADRAKPSPQEPQAFTPLPLGEVKPAGWLQRQLRIQADGMTGHLYEFWPDVGPTSGWLGGTGESWERGPYYLDGLLPLAVLLDDARLRTLANRFVEWTLTHQQANGQIGPASNDDWWPRMVMCKVLQQHYEATQDERVVPLLTRYFHYQLAAMPAAPLHDWGKFRWQDEALVMQWLHTKTGDPKLLELVSLLKQQGFDWVGSFADFPFKGKVDSKAILDGVGGANNAHGYQSHGVNNGMALKTAAVEARMGDVAGKRSGFYRQMGALDEYHGLPNGMFSCDEHLAGRNPSQGSELCTVVETMFSLEVALAMFGDAPIADRLEKIAYNALPGTITADMWAHQYDQQPNQVQCSLNTKPWTTNGPESNLFGLEPHFGCCTANYHQGWPKFVASLWMRSSDDGLAAVAYGPCTVNTTVRGVRVRAEQQTEYPFRERVTIAVNPEKAVRFPLQLRVPEWAKNATVRVNGEAFAGAVKPGSFAVIDREWKSGDRVEVHLPMQPRISRWFNQSVALERGPLVFSYSPGEHWVKLRDRGLTADWQVFPDRGWNYALAVDEKSAGALAVQEGDIGAMPFAAESESVRLTVPARQLDAWRVEDGVAPPPPVSPVKTAADAETVELVPYGSARLRVTAFPAVSG
ncbi:glycoside hydrolase family 127 protein [Terriglobus aquaticus]|uniref:Glycoside hydrolase family 127 protein n=1 Tax=Terriglobus aquaticus TaxID=940139 RepID=A0ABW9KNT7_9BACT|nr:glycoside hydrolase family 127 protein [Terriglobus aquaticus]